MGKWTRRGFITAGVLASGVVVFGVAIRPGNRAGKVKDLVAKEDEVLFNIWIKISPDNVVTAILPHSEMGQGVFTSLGMMIAEELDVNWDKLKMEEAPAHKEYVNHMLAKGFLAGGVDIPPFLDETIDGVFLAATKSMNLQMTGGSGSVRFTGGLGLRHAAANTRALLLSAAADHWNVDVKELETKESTIYHRSSNRSESYAFFAPAAVEKSVPDNVPLKSEKNYSIVGKSITRIDLPSKVNGTASFGLDVSPPGMKYATVMAAPVFGNKVASFNENELKEQPGVLKVVNLENAVAVIAEGYWQAKTALNKAKIIWTVSDNDKVDQESIYQQYADDLARAIENEELETDLELGDSVVALQDAQNLFEAEYKIPFLAHSTMEPMNCTVWVHDGKCDIWCGSQNPLAFASDVAEMLEIELADVTVNNQFLGGGFGRRVETDVVKQATRIAREVNYPVKLIWSREEDTRHDFYREANISRFKAILDKSGYPTVWKNQFLFKHHPPEASIIPYEIENQLVQHTTSPTHVPWGNWRSVDHSMHGFFIESFVDELANEANADAYTFRRKLLINKPRFLAVLDMAAEKSNWGSPLPENWGRGIAIHKSFGTIVCEVAEIEMTNGKIKVHRVVCVADPGYAIHPDGFIAQMEGGIIYGLTAALYGKITIQNGAVKQSNFHDYQMLRMDESPKIDTYIINGGNPLGGGGEPATPPIAAAVTNAVFNATGKRIRELPLS